MMELRYLFAGFAVFWGGIFLYLLLLQARLRGLGREIERLEERLAEEDAAPPPAPARPAVGGRTEPPAPR